MGPDLAHHLQKLVATRIALVVVEVVAVLALLAVIAATDHVQRQASVEQVIEGRQLARGQGRRHEAGAMRQQKADTRRRQPGQGRDQKAVGLIRPVPHQNPVEACLLVHLGKTGDVRLVEDRASRIEGLRRQAVADHADELNAHGGSLKRAKKAYWL